MADKSTPFRLLYAVTAASWGGAPQHVLDLARYMLTRGHPVGIVAAPEARLMREAKALGARFFPNPYFTLSLTPRRDILTVLPILRAIQEFQPDLIHAHSTKAGLAARLAAVLTRRPAVFTAHGWGFAETRAWWTPHVLRWLERLAARVTERIICVSYFDYELALRYITEQPEKLTVIWNGIAPGPYLEASKRARTLGHRRSDPVFISVGRLAPPKDFQTLLSALQYLPTGRLLVVGDGPDRPQVEIWVRSAGLNDRVTLLGEREDVPALLTSADIFLLSSRKEGLPRAVIEAMMAGLPIVATNVGGLPELVEHQQTGLLVPPGDPQALAQAVKILIDNPALAKQMGAAGQRKALSDFTLDRMCERTYQAYREVLRQPPPASSDTPNMALETRPLPRPEHPSVRP